MGEESLSRKKMTSLFILEILKKYTDCSIDSEGRYIHTLNQRQIREYLEKDYGIKLDRKAISRGLFDLTEFFNDKILYDVETRKSATSQSSDNEMRTNFHYCHDFDSAQVRFLMEAVLFSKNISQAECKELLNNISKLIEVDSGKRLKKHFANLQRLSADRISNDETLNSIDVIDEAIEKGKQISFVVNEYHKDKKLHPKSDPEGNPLVRIVNPYAIVANNGNYYLVCNYDEFNYSMNIRIDRITNVNILDSYCKNKKLVKGLKEIPATIAEQMYMMEGESQIIEFSAANNSRIISELIDWFGNGITFVKENGADVICRVKANPKAIKLWAMQYVDYVEIISPASLREDIIESLKSAAMKYKDEALISVSEEGHNLLIRNWKALCKDAEKGRFDVQVMSKLVKQTYITFLPFRKEDLTEQYVILLDVLKTIQRKSRTNVISHLNLISTVLEELIKKAENNIKYRRATDIPDTILIIEKRKHGEEKGKLEFKIDINNFEEDYLTLLQFTDEESVISKAEFAMLHEKIKEKMRNNHGISN